MSPLNITHQHCPFNPPKTGKLMGNSTSRDQRLLLGSPTSTLSHNRGTPNIGSFPFSFPLNLSQKRMPRAEAANLGARPVPLRVPTQAPPVNGINGPWLKRDMVGSSKIFGWLVLFLRLGTLSAWSEGETQGKPPANAETNRNPCSGPFKDVHSLVVCTNLTCKGVPCVDKPTPA